MYPPQKNTFAPGTHTNLNKIYFSGQLLFYKLRNILQNKSRQKEKLLNDCDFFSKFKYQNTTYSDLSNLLRCFSIFKQLYEQFYSSFADYCGNIKHIFTTLSIIE